MADETKAPMPWRTVGCPGYLGKHRDEKFQEWNERYGTDNWRLVWEVNGNQIDFLGVCAIYEDAYFEFLLCNPDVLNQLVDEAKEVYDDEISNINSGLDYQIQETGRTHVQDIAIRNCLVRLGTWFGGRELVRIRQEKGTHPLSTTLSPGRVPFHQPSWIKQPEITDKWWWPQTVEAFYQCNRVLQILEP